MSTQSEALRWVHLLEYEAAAHGATDYKHKAAAELRRLHEENERLKTVPMKYRRMEFNAQLQEENKRLHEVNQELLEMVGDVLAFVENDWSVPSELIKAARAAIIKATGESK